MELKLLFEIVVIFSLSIIVVFLFHKIKLPAIIGFLLTGLIAGPYGFEFVSDVHDVEYLAEIGILLLLFTIGIEFSFKEILQLKKPVLLGGSLQVLLTIAVVFGVAHFNVPLNEAVFIGFLITLSSTAIVLRILNDKGQIDSPHGRNALAILIYQDIIVVPMMLVIPILAGTSGNLTNEILLLVGKAALVILFVFVSTKYIVPFLLFNIAKTKSRELFLLSIFVICFGIVGLTSLIGLSLALGAFLAGLIISESDYSHQALGNVLPFRDIFTSLFFVSIGMLLDFRFLLDNLLFVLLISLIIIIVKFKVTSFSVWLTGMPLRTAILTGLALSQVGEFSFILAKTGLDFGFLSGSAYQSFLSISIITMALTPFLINFSQTGANMILKLPIPRKIKREAFHQREERHKPNLTDHLIIVGYGVNGKNLALSAKAANIPYIILEMNVDTVKREKALGEPIFFGDASNEEVLIFAGIKSARIIVVAINDITAVRRITSNIKALNPAIHSIIRTRHVNEMEMLYKLGASEVIPEEFETSVEIFTRVLSKYLVPQNQITEFVDRIRTSGYHMFRSLSPETNSFPGIKLHFPDLEVCSFVVEENSFAAGKTLAELNLRNNYGLTLLAIRNESETNSNPTAQSKLLPKNIVFVLAKHEAVKEASKLFKNQYEEN